MVVVASKEKGHAPPPHLIWDCLNEPSEPADHPWLVLIDSEVAPRVLEANRSGLVVWSSPWPDRPRDQIQVTSTSDGDGARVRWTWATPDPPPDEATVRARRHRLNQVVNADLRFFLDWY